MGFRGVENLFRKKGFWFGLFPGLTGIIYFFTAMFLELAFEIQSPLAFLQIIYNFVLGPIQGLLFFTMDIFLKSSPLDATMYLEPILALVQKPSQFPTGGFILMGLSILLFFGYISFVGKVETMGRKSLIGIGIIILLSLIFSTIAYLLFFMGKLDFSWF